MNSASSACRRFGESFVLPAAASVADGDVEKRAVIVGCGAVWVGRVGFGMGAGWFGAVGSFGWVR